MENQWDEFVIIQRFIVSSAVHLVPPSATDFVWVEKADST